MLSVKITETGEKEIGRLKISLDEVLNRIIEYIPKIDLIGLKYLYVTGEPGKCREHLASATGAYFQKSKNSPAYIEIYLSRILGHINSSESAQLLVQFQNICLAQTVFHEVGHHVEKLRSHGISKKKRETFAKNYEQKLLSKYLTDNADSINKSFRNLENIVEQKGLSQEALKKVKDDTESQLKGLGN